jgi:hypothetical protein
MIWPQVWHSSAASASRTSASFHFICPNIKTGMSQSVTVPIASHLFSMTATFERHTIYGTFLSISNWQSALQHTFEYRPRAGEL